MSQSLKWNLAIAVSGGVDFYTGLLSPFSDVIPSFLYMLRGQDSLRNQISMPRLDTELFGF